MWGGGGVPSNRFEPDDIVRTLVWICFLVAPNWNGKVWRVYRIDSLCLLVNQKNNYLYIINLCRKCLSDCDYVAKLLIVMNRTRRLQVCLCRYCSVNLRRKSYF
jgi:hypothetical protein